MNSPQYVTLKEWAGSKFNEPPSIATLRAMVKADKFHPPAVKIGKAYYVEPGAKVVDPNRRRSLVERMQEEEA